jgi:hypothetical protein
LALEDCRIIDLTKIAEARGNLTFIEGSGQVSLASHPVE